MNTVYIITQGEYSDYHILGVFSTEEKAQEMVNWCGNDCIIEEYTIDECIPIPDETRWPYHIELQLSSGNILSIINENSRPFPNETINMSSTINDIWIKNDHLIITCWAETEDQAKKIATEKRQEYLAKQGLSNKL